MTHKETSSAARRKTARISLVASVVVVVVVVVGVAARKINHDFEDAIVTQTQLHLLNIARTGAQDVQERVTDLLSELQVLAQNPCIARAVIDNESAQDISTREGYSLEVASYDHLKTRIQALYRLDAKGIVQSRMPFEEGEEGTDLSYKPDVRKVLQDQKPHISECFTKEGGTKCFSVCYPVFKEGQFLGIVQAVVPLRFIRDIIESIKVGHKGYAQVFDDDGIMVAHPKLKHMGEDVIAIRKKAFPDADWSELEDILRKMHRGEEGVGSYHSAWWQDEHQLKRVRKLTAFAPIEIDNELWSLSVTMGYSEVAGPIVAHTRNVSIVAGLLILFFLGVGFWFYRTEKTKAIMVAKAESADRLRDTNEQLRSEIAARQRIELELVRARDDAKLANLSKSEFLANMSHEIRTPMTAILGFSEVLLENITCCTKCSEHDNCESRREAKTQIETISANGAYLARIIDDILDLSKIEAGKLEVEYIQCSPSQVLSEVASLMRVRAHAKNLLLEVDYDGHIPRSIQSDPTRLRQILINLVGNALKFTEVGKIRLVARLLDPESDTPRMQFEVIDSGIGMTKAQVNQLFKPFCQADSSTTRKFGGTGLGLAISKRLAEKLGGDIAVTSTPGEGSTFTVTIATGPLSGIELLENPTEAQTRNESSRSPDIGKTTLDCRLLLAEDGPDNQRLIALLLKKAGADVTIAENGQVAYDLAIAAMQKGTSFDVILMDVQMPVMDGNKATAELRKAGYTGPIIALTAHAMAQYRNECLRAGCDDFLTKPINRRQLISTVATHAATSELVGARDS